MEICPESLGAMLEYSEVESGQLRSNIRTASRLNIWIIHEFDNSYPTSDGLASHPGGSGNTPSRFKLQKLG